MTNTVMSSADVREAFLAYFESKQHQRVASSSLIPGNDPTLLFTNAGMVQFKDVFLGSEKRAYSTACSSQRCVRAGGKHNDLENVGYTARHHTFFEMLGNFSFGDYFKREAIQYAWEFLTEVLKLPKEKLWVTVHISDDEAERIWKDEVGIDPTRFSKLDEDNFWQMGDTGPCGPSSEIFYDHGADIFGDPPGGENDDGDRYIEIWNLVFMQYERSADGKLTPLPKPSVDTGMGLERIAAVMQGVHSNYEIDLFQNLLQAVATLADCNDLGNQSLRVIAGHIRSCSFLVLDGVLPGNEGRAYVLRRIIRRAIRHGNKLGMRDAFFYKLVGALVNEMGDAYPDLRQQQAQIETVLHEEEKVFARTLDNGLSVLEQELDKLSSKVIPGEVVFKLYDTFGFPYDLTNDIARERGYTLDSDGYDKAMQQQRDRSKKSNDFGVDYAYQISVDSVTDFVGYDNQESESSIVAIFCEKPDGAYEIDSVSEGESATLVLDSTPFYAESGGQIGDNGFIECGDSLFFVDGTYKVGSAFAHAGTVEKGDFSKNDKVKAKIDSDDRSKIAANHSATHLLHAALREILGEHVQQKGSLVDKNKLRFDFSNPEPVSTAQLNQVQQRVNEQIRKNTAVGVELMSMDAAKQKGAMALFGEKYGDEVRVLSMGDGFSVELCGGTHVERTGDIGMMMITQETGIAGGVRRIEAVTGDLALNEVTQLQAKLEQTAQLLKAPKDNVLDKVKQLIDSNKTLEKNIQALQSKLASSAGNDLAEKAKDVNGVAVLAESVAITDRKALLSTMDQLKNKLGSGVIVLAAVNGDAISLVAGVTKDLVGQYHAGNLLKHVATQVGGKGGGKPEMAQGAGSEPDKLDAALNSVDEYIRSQA